MEGSYVDSEIRKETGRRLQQADLKVGETDEPAVNEMVSLGVPRPSHHDIQLRTLVGQGNGRHLGVWAREAGRVGNSWFVKKAYWSKVEHVCASGTRMSACIQTQ